MAPGLIIALFMRLLAMTSINKIGIAAFAVLLLSLNAHARLLKDVVYSQAGGTQLTLDASIPDGPGPFPAAVLVHGGGWVAGDKQQYITYIFEPLSNAGFAWFSIN